MRRGTTVLFAMAVLLACASSAQATERCTPKKGERELQRSPRILLFEDPDFGPPISCYRPTGARKRLTGRGLTRLAGRYVSFSWFENYGANEAYVGIDIWDLKSGRQTTLWVGNPDDGDHFYDAVLKPSGAIAWTDGKALWACRGGCFGYPAPTVKLAEGADIEKRSLEERRTGIRWRQAGRWRYAKLGG